MDSDSTMETHTLDALSAQKFRSLVEAIADIAIYMLDPDGYIISWNAGAERFKGHAREEVLGKHFGMFYTEDDRAAGMPDRTLSIARNEGRFEGEGWRLRKDGQRFWAHVIMDCITDEEGTVIGYAKITRDVTSQRIASEQLEQARRELSQAQKLEAIGQLTGGVAHDFNNLLMVMQSTLDMIRLKSADPDQVVNLVGLAQAAVKRGATLTQRMLAFARKQELHTEVIDVYDLVNGMGDMLQWVLGQRIHLIMTLSKETDKVLIDANQLELALMNLTVNARDAMPMTGTVTFSARNVRVAQAHPTELPPGDYVCLSVVDDGTGMDADTLAKAADPFFTTKGVDRGTGLGLSMVHGLMEQSGGRMVIRSTQGAGTRIELWLPTASAQADAATSPAPARRPAPSPGAGSQRILVVDDNPLVRSTTSAALESMGHSTLEAASAEEALATIERDEAVDILLTDHVMAGMTGAQLTNLVKSRWPGMPIVLASAFADIHDNPPAGVVRLAKPYGRDDLVQAINAVLGKQARQARG